MTFAGIVAAVGGLVYAAFLPGQLRSGVAKLGVSFGEVDKSSRPVSYWLTILLQVLIVCGCAWALLTPGFRL